MAPRGSPPDPGRRSDTSRRATLTAAWELVGELPCAKVTVEAIAARAGVSKATIYRWWPSRGAILVDAFAERAVTADLPDTGDFRADMHTVVHGIVEEFSDPATDVFFRALTVETLQDERLRDQVVERIHTVQLEGAARRFDAARAAGQLRDDVDDLLVLEFFVGPVLHRWQSGTQPLSREHADQIVDLAIRALAPR